MICKEVVDAFVHLNTGFVKVQKWSVIPYMQETVCKNTWISALCCTSHYENKSNGSNFFFCAARILSAAILNFTVSIRTTSKFINNCLTSMFSMSLLLSLFVKLRSAWLFYSLNLWTMTLRYYENTILILVSPLKLKGCNIIQTQALQNFPLCIWCNSLCCYDTKKTFTLQKIQVDESICKTFLKSWIFYSTHIS